MFDWFKRLTGKNKQKQKRVEAEERSNNQAAQARSPQGTSESLRSLLKTAIADAEQIVTSIKMKAQTEAETEADRIIAQAKREVEEIKTKAEIDAQKQVEDLLAEAKRKAEITEVEAKQKALQYLIRASETLLGTSQAIKPPLEIVTPEDTGLKSVKAAQEVEEKSRKSILPWKRTATDKTDKMEEAPPSPTVSTEGLAGTIQQLVEAAMSQPEPAAEKAEVHLPPEVSRKEATEPADLRITEPALSQQETVIEKVEEIPSSPEVYAPKATEVNLPRMGNHQLYSGEVELIIAPSTELRLVSRLYNSLQTVPELRILYTRGSWDQGTTITIVLEKPIPLLDTFLRATDIEITPEPLAEGVAAPGKSSSLFRGEARGVKKKIKLSLKDAN
ncbi:MAG: hypothetical protein Q8Q07_05450 [Dehalococcoidales bacterium]|nr:hypothetical protein [Dehalococcoidales bacterium]